MRFNVALIVLHDSQKKILLQHRSADARILPGYWAFFGGRINNEETPAMAVRREALEELNYKLKNPLLMVEEDFQEGDAEGRLFVYIEYIDKDKSILRLREGQGWGWYSESEINNLKMVERDKRISKSIWDYLGKGS